MTEQHELFMMKMEMESLQFLKAIRDTQNEGVILDESVKRKTTTLAVEITNEPTVTATTKENTTCINEPETTMINKPAPPKNRSGENLPTEIDNKQAKITCDTAEIAEIATESAEYQVITDEPANITELAEYEITDEPTPTEITLNMLASEPVQTNVLSTKPLEIIYESTEVISVPDKTMHRPVERDINANVPTEISNRLTDAQAGTDEQCVETKAIINEPAETQDITDKRLSPTN